MITDLNSLCFSSIL